MSHEERLAAAAAVPWKAQGSTSVFSYSNTDYSALALRVERLRGQELGEVLHTDIAEHLGLQDTLMTGAENAPQKMVHGYILSDEANWLTPPCLHSTSVPPTPE